MNWCICACRITTYYSSELVYMRIPPPEMPQLITVICSFVPFVDFDLHFSCTGITVATVLMLHRVYCSYSTFVA
jgi:hypothetical protein